jgi:hypothetical protein
MTEKELLALVAQDSNDYDEGIDGWLVVDASAGTLTVEVSHAAGGRTLASWRLELVSIEEER